MIVVNFATKPYYKGQERLVSSLKGAKSLIMRDYLGGCPTHQQSPYEFKIHAIEKAFELDDVVLWCDASLFLVGDLSKVENIILQDGYFMEEAGHYVKDWCNASTRDYFKLTESEKGFIMFSAGFLGLNKNSPIAMDFFSQWKASAKAGCFKGDWSNHRHDMTCGSIIAQRLGMKYQRGGSHMAYIGQGYSKPESGVVFHLQGIP
jgi:hypothetical protein